jgi:SAM-dependent methyltransferase
MYQGAQLPKPGTKMTSSAGPNRHSELSGARARLLSLLHRERPERKAGGFTRDDGTVQFYLRINALLFRDATLLDFGAGRGRQFDIPDPGYPEELQKFQGKVKKVIGTDAHDGIRDHPYLDERHVTPPGMPLPLQPASVDIVVADWVFEHLENPAQFVQEMERVVKRGGWVCARTINRWGYIGIGARLLPNSSHERIVRKLIPVAKSLDVFPTHYRLNSLKDVRRRFSSTHWEDCSFLLNTTPRYFGNSRTLFHLTDVYQKFVPYRLSTDLFIFVRRI